jgi:phage terminase large subunit-like protein
VPTEFWFDERAATGAVRFFERIIRHTKGEWGGQPFMLQPWQRDDVIRPLFGWKRPDGTRRYRKLYLEVPRKNGKSTLSAAIALYLLFADLGPDGRSEPVAEIYSAAADRGQAGIVFEEAKRMVEDSPMLRREAEIYRGSIVVPKTRSSYKVLSADAFTKHGLNAHGVIFDELHAQPTPDLWEVLKTSFGSRRQPLMVEITTAGYDRESICWREHEEARRVIEGLEARDDLLPLIFGADEADDWTDPAIWAKANPNLGVSVKRDYLQSECDAARLTPAYQNTFRRLHLNQWTQQVTRWLPMEQWQACGAHDVDEGELAGRTCYGGLDLASTTDLAALVLVFPPQVEQEPYQLVCRFWCPAEQIVERSRRDRVPYDAWARDGLIRATEGNVIDYATIAADIEALNEKFNIAEIAFDRWGAVQMSQQLDGAGLVMVPFGQGFASMSAPSKEFLRLILDGKLAHGGHPILRWMADNVSARQDPAGNVKPDKAKSTGRIDGIVAAVMGLDRATRHNTSVYEDHGIFVL